MAARPPPAAPARMLAHPVVAGTLALLVLVVTWVVAEQSSLPSWDRTGALRINDAPGWVADALWPVMQLGTIWSPLAIAVVLGVALRDRAYALATAAAGVGTWVAAHAAKEIVDRGRPPAFLSGIDVREGTGGGLGYPSGHSAVAAATAVMVAAAIPRRLRPLLAVLAGLVGVARIVFGLHFPLDVLGGWALGTLAGVAVLAGYERLRALAG